MLFFETNTIQTTAGQATAELQRRGINASDPVTIVVPSSADMLVATRAAARAQIAAAELSDDDIEGLIEKARAEIAAEDK